MIGRKAEEVLNRAVRYAFERKHEYFTLEHVLLSLLEEPTVQEVLRSCRGNPGTMKEALEGYLDKEVPPAQPPATPPEEGDASDGDQIEHPVATLGIQRLIQRALFHVQSAGKDEIRPTDLLVAMFQSKDSYSLSLLQQQGIDRLDVLNFLSHGVRKEGDSGSEEGDSSSKPEGESTGGRGQKSVATEALQSYTTCLNDLALKGKIDPLVGRQNELERIIQTLCRRRKNNPLLVGEAGVGKTAIVEGLALRVTSGDVPDLLAQAQIYSLDMGSLLAGAKFRGDFEQRIKRVLQALNAKKEKGEYPVLFIDEIHTLIGAGSVSGGVLDAANLLKPFLSRGEVQCIGSTTYAEYRSTFEKDHALARRFQKIDVTEPTQEEALQILNGLKKNFEEHHRVQYTPDALKSAVELSVKHMNDRFLPDKAIDLIDEAGAKARLARAKENKEKVADSKNAESKSVIESRVDQADSETSIVDARSIESIVAQIARIPERSVNTHQKTRLKNLERDLRLTIFGQDHAVDALVASIQLSRSGLRSGDKPVGSFLFCGPTGVGKTELSKQLGHCLGVPFLRFDMSEYMERHTVSRLIGAPPGYVGFEQAGLLTDAVLKNPHAVVLLDEIEKAHSDVWNILLQIMDHGTLTDNNGRKSDFRNVILIMTSNVGSREHERRPLGMSGTGAETATASKKEVERTFSPEFRNRLDAIIYFNPLDPVTIAQVVGKQLLELETQLLAKGVEVELDSEVREWLASQGYDRQMGARPMGRLIQERIKKPLAQEILFGVLDQGGKVKISLSKGEPVFQYEPKKVSAPESDSEPTEKDTRHAE